MLKAVETGIRWVALGLALIAGLALLAMMVQTVVDVLMKNLAGRPIEGNLEIMSVYHMVGDRLSAVGHCRN